MRRKPGAAKRKTQRKMVKRPGTFTAWCKRHGYGGPSMKCACAAYKRGNITVKRKAMFYAGMVRKTSLKGACGGGASKRKSKKRR